jgi:peptidoglycan/LPS O-acetylase OafA/YrhL
LKQVEISCEVQLFKEIPRRGFPELDTLRFVSVTLVICHHLFFKSDPFLSWLATHGYVGVDIFFTLSGFIITKALLKEYERIETIELKKFWIRRSLRLWPAWLCVLALSCIAVFYLGLNNPDIMAALKEKWWHYFLHFGNYSHAYIGKLHTLFSHFWSLAVEEHFYLIWPLLFLLMRKRESLKWFLYLLLLVLPFIFRVISAKAGYENIVNTFSTHTRFDSLALGCLLGELWPRLPHIENRAKGYALWLAFFFMMAMGLEFKFSDNILIKQFGFSLRAFASGLLIYLLLKVKPGFIRYVFSLSWLSKIGVLSYGAYLYHFITNTIVFKLLDSTKLEVGHYIILVLANVIVYIPSYISYQSIESYFEGMKSRYRA